MVLKIKTQSERNAMRHKKRWQKKGHRAFYQRTGRNAWTVFVY